MRAGVVAFAITLAAASARAESPLSPEQSRQLHEAVCATAIVQQDDGTWHCPAARDYPGAEACPITIAPDKVYVGRFTADASQALAVYQADCESHANNWGGMALLRVDNGRFTLLRYLPGWAMTECVVVPGERRDVPFCTSSFMAQGQVSETFGPLSFDGHGKVDFAPWLSAGNAEGFYGETLASCAADDAFQPHHIISIRQEAPGDITVTVAHADPAAIRHACSHPRTRAAADGMTAPPGHTFLDDARLVRAHARFHPPSRKRQVEFTAESADE